MISPFYKTKCLMCGSQGVGKSTIVNLFNDVIVNQSIAATIGIEFMTITCELKEYMRKGPLPDFYFKNKNTQKTKGDFPQTVKVHIWDASGDIRFATIVKSYLRDVDFAFMVFDLSYRNSWDNLIRWKQNLEDNNKKLPMLILVGCKSDIKPYQITEQEIEQRSKEWNAKLYILSCFENYSSNVVKSMLYKTMCDFHDYACNLDELPEHLTSEYYAKEKPVIDLNVEESQKYCCYQ